VKVLAKTKFKETEIGKIPEDWGIKPIEAEIRKNLKRLELRV